MMFQKVRFYFSLYFPIRYYLRRDIFDFSKKYNFSGKIIDAGCGGKPFSNLFEKVEYVGVDFEKYSTNKDLPKQKPDYFFSESYREDLVLPFMENSFDGAVSFQMLEHHPNPEKLIAEMARVVKSGGSLLLTFPFIYPLHEEPNDFQRWTHHKVKLLLEQNNYEVMEMKKQGALWSTIAMLLNENLNYFATKSKLNYFLSGVAYPFLLVLQYLNLGLDKIFPTDKVFINYIVLARKK